MRAGRPRMLAHIDARPDDSSGGVHVVAVKTGAMILVLADHAEAAEGRAMPFPSARDAGRGGAMFAAEEIGPLLAEIDHDMGTPGMPLRNVRDDEIAHRAAGV